MWLFYYFTFERNYDVLKKSKNPCFLLNKNINFNNKNKTKSKMEKPPQTFREMSLGLVKEKRAFFVTFILTEGNFLNICVLSQCILYWINFQNNYTFAYQKASPHTLSSHVFKIIESLRREWSHQINNWFRRFIHYSTQFIWQTKTFHSDSNWKYFIRKFH